MDEAVKGWPDGPAAMSGLALLVSLASPQNPSGVASPVEDLRALLDEMSRLAPDAMA